MKRDDFIRKSLEENLSGLYVSGQHRSELLDTITGGVRMKKKKMTVSAAVLAALMLMACTACALVGTPLLEHLFPKGEIREESYEYLLQRTEAASENGVTLSVEETLFDGRTIHVMGSVRNDTDETLYVAATMPRINGMEPDSFGGNFLFNYGIDYMAIAPGQTLSGTVYSNYDPLIFEKEDGYVVMIEAYALRATAEIPPAQEEWYSAKTFTAENSEQAAHVKLEYRIEGSQIGKALYTKAEQSVYRMDECTLIIREANFAPGGTFIEFDIRADHAEDAVLGRLDHADDGRLARWYAIFDDKGNKLNDIAVGGGEYSGSDDGVLSYVYDFTPLSEVPSSITIVPIEGERLMTEAGVTVEIVPAE